MTRKETNVPGLFVRPAQPDDMGLLLAFIREMAAYERLLSEVRATEEILFDSLFVKHAAEVLFAELEGKCVGYAVYCHNFSTFTGRWGLYVEDIFISPEYRGRGFGKALLVYLANVAREEGCGRMEWCCLDWNAPSIAFYKRMGAKPMEEWTIYRLTEDQLPGLGEK